MNEMIYTYDGSFEGFLCCIFDSYANKEVLTAITDDEDSAPILFPVRAIQTDSGHAGRVLRKLHKLSPYGEELVRRGFLTCMEDREIRLYRLVVKLLREGPGFLRNFSDETLSSGSDSRPAPQRRGPPVEGLCPLLRAGRRPGQRDRAEKPGPAPFCGATSAPAIKTRNFSFMTAPTTRRCFTPPARRSSARWRTFRWRRRMKRRPHYRLLWKRFYDTIAIRERENPKLRMTHMPKRYWGTMTEFQDASLFHAAKLSRSRSSPRRSSRETCT